MDEMGRIRERAGAHTDAPALLGAPLPVRDRGGRMTSWFVPIVDGDHIAGFVELATDLSHRRTSSFRRHPGDPAPLARSWLDPGSVLERARTSMAATDVPGEPFLSFDGVPDRIAWAVPVRGASGSRTVYVAGDAVWFGTGTTGLG